MVQDKLIDAAPGQEARPEFAAGPLLIELLSDPIMHMLMAADRVEIGISRPCCREPARSSGLVRVVS